MDHACLKLRAGKAILYWWGLRNRKALGVCISHPYTLTGFQVAGCNSELDYTEQTSWMFFLKYLDVLADEREVEAKINGET